MNTQASRVSGDIEYVLGPVPEPALVAPLPFWRRALAHGGVRRALVLVVEDGHFHAGEGAANGNNSAAWP